ncbi:ABC transporter ATP-binding protein/permease [Porticoccaceae bacterium]|nr:ABC transporter ATP-binding protein/permease [Porticoccaceae bacterium]
MKTKNYWSVKKLAARILVTKKKELMGLFALILASSIADIISISAIIPFLGLLTNPETVISHPVVINLFGSSGILLDQNLFLIYVSIAFVMLVLLAGVVRLVFLRRITRFSYNTGSEISSDFFSKIIYLPYEEQIKTKSADAIAGITAKINSTVSVINALVMLFGNMVIFVLLSGLIVYINYKVALSSVAVLVLSYFVVAKMTRNRLLSNSVVISSRTNSLVSILQESLGGIRDVIIDKLEPFFIVRYAPIDKELRLAMGDNIYRGGAPRYIMETVGIVVMVGMSIYLVFTLDDSAFVIPLLGVIALTAQRLLPVMQQIFGAWAMIMGHKSELDYVMTTLDRTVEITSGSPEIRFDNTIELKNISYAYVENVSKTIPILSNVNLTINKGDVIGIVGETGSGKSTLVDIIMGLLVGFDGKIRIDGVNINKNNISDWRAKIAHVPQDVFLKDDSIASNVAFGTSGDLTIVPKIERAIEMAQLKEFTGSLKEGINYRVGERGINLSGGQKQRIGIARAIYKNSDLIVLDEATSALDSNTESEIMDMIDKLERNTTLIIIAHRLTTLKKCNRICQISNRGLKEIDTKEFFDKNN